eukprot:CAMPEP_0114680468 /NCGR_PEP_ID=MMETSP0191-20121206/54203_1 /TAXON_ID=126664 /ORGANISM="Sorites sp." /LENGTH=65 /DNA_ID=CAMNT_0001957371 /DNA_START=41 /DNA_END=234 /DNA_ORIENTATION=+
MNPGSGTVSDKRRQQFQEKGRQRENAVMAKEDDASQSMQLDNWDLYRKCFGNKKASKELSKEEVA